MIDPMYAFHMEEEEEYNAWEKEYRAKKEEGRKNMSAIEIAVEDYQDALRGLKSAVDRIAQGYERQASKLAQELQELKDHVR